MKKNVLLAEDNADVAELTRVRLEAGGYSVRVAPDGLRAIELALEEVPDIALVDIRLPGLDGYQLCKRLKATPETRNVPIILFTGTSRYMRDIARMCLELGAQDFLLKPFEPEVLIQKIEAAIQTKLIHGR